MIGSGHIPYKEVFAELKKLKYDGWVVVESFGSSFKELAAACCIWRDLLPDPEVFAKEALKYLRNIASS